MTYIIEYTPQLNNSYLTTKCNSFDEAYNYLIAILKENKNAYESARILKDGKIVLSLREIR